MAPLAVDFAPFFTIIIGDFLGECIDELVGRIGMKPGGGDI